jgi:glycolate oxidase FAD binding subunit
MESVPVLSPPDVPSLAALLEQANRDRTAIAPRGGGTKWSWGSPPTRIDAILSTRGLDAPVDHCAGDLTATVSAGMTLDAVNAVLARSGQWLPLDPPAGHRATIGGIVAANDSGPRRQKHGAPRDLIIGVELVRADGRIAKAGGKVVKNVAGYDLARMLCGSLGSLAVITRATFKLAPMAAASRTVVATTRDARASADLALAVAAAPSAPSAIEVQSPPHRLLVRFETTERAADQQAEATAALCRSRGAGAAILAGAEEIDLWNGYQAAVWNDSPGTILVKVSVLPTEVGELLQQADAVAAAGRAALGVVYLRMSDGPPEGGHYGINDGPPRGGHYENIEALRRRASARGGSVVVLSAPPGARAQIDAWGEIGSALTVMRAVKARFDPNGILNPGRGPGGL